MDTCLVSGDKPLSWPDAWATCSNTGARLLEFPNATYDSKYPALASPVFSSQADHRWLGFIRNTSANPAVRRWYHGLLSEDMTYNPNIGTIVGSVPPFCGRATKISSRNTWSEETCSPGIDRTYFCQFLLEEGMYNKQSGCSMYRLLYFFLQ